MKIRMCSMEIGTKIYAKRAAMKTKQERIEIAIRASAELDLAAKRNRRVENHATHSRMTLVTAKIPAS